jgi:L-2-hydroxyglutarate oxidase LhgO
MTTRSPVGPPAMPAEWRRLQQSDRCQQMDLFDGVTPAQLPVWQDLPEETRDTLTGLMARLILEHAQISSPAVQTEVGDDH